MIKEPDFVNASWIKENSYVSTFKIYSSESVNRGEYFNNLKLSEIYLVQHQNISEILTTIEHEDVHRSIAYLEEVDNLSIVTEHYITRLMLLIKDDII